jgi:hypothetical protein
MKQKSNQKQNKTKTKLKLTCILHVSFFYRKNQKSRYQKKGEKLLIKKKVRLVVDEERSLGE